MAVHEELTTYIALFHHRDNAASAIRDLEASGFATEAFTVVSGGNESTQADAATAFGQEHGYAHRNSLAEIGVPEADRERLQRGLDKGGIVIALQGAGQRADEIEKIFSKHATKIDERKAERVGDAVPAAMAAASAATIDGTVIPITQEELVVGKRTVDRGGVRVFRRVVEEPVSESVYLRDEQVVVDRRPVDRAATDADFFKGDRVIELTESTEEAVVLKTARVVEEVHVGKEATERVETVHNTVRRTEVDVEQLGFEDRARTETKY